jgi:hypothetical protein
MPNRYCKLFFLASDWLAANLNFSAELVSSWLLCRTGNTAANVTSPMSLTRNENFDGISMYEKLARLNKVSRFDYWEEYQLLKPLDCDYSYPLHFDDHR